jgi:D-lactate dehydrogenase (cytochrome)
MISYNPVTDELLGRLAAVVGEAAVSTAEAERQARAKDMSHHAAHLSEAVVWPQTAEQVAAILRLAHEAGVPVTPWGAGSSLEGNPIPLHGGLLLAMERMDRVVAVHPADFQVTVQPGLGYKDLNLRLAPDGLFFAPDPGANASIGGMLANNAAGSRTVKYGATKDNVLAMQVALADGRLIRVGSRSVKQSAGYDLLHLFVGSEGTLGVITEATLKLVPRPAVMSAVVATFPAVAAAIEAVVAIRGTGLDVAALEFVGAETAAVATREAGVDWGERPTVLMEIHAAHSASAELDLALVQQICRELGATGFRATMDPTERQALWHVRHHLFEMLLRAFPGTHWIVLDIAVPISSYPELVAAAESALAAEAMFGSLIGHAGDGNLHVAVAYSDDDGLRRAERINEAVVSQAIALGGTSTGEHGVGIGKRQFMVAEHATAVDVMREIKQTLDPRGILNPGKVLP